MPSLNPSRINILDNSQGVEWFDDANCKDMELELFFPPLGATIDPFVREVCAQCTVNEKCLWYANETASDHGVFAGMSPDERRKWRRKNNVALGMSKKEWSNHVNPV